jgi:Na+-transporting NADH:ubiquinone oxidoreductase subunit NqrB
MLLKLTTSIKDPRLYQILVLGSLLVYGLTVLELDVSIWQILVTMSSALITQWVCTRLFGLPFFDPKSAFISSLSLSLLFRTDVIWLAAVVAAIAMSSKFLFRYNNKHIFNPANLGLVVMMLLTDHAWVSPGQWGTLAYLAFLLACAGIVVVYRSERSDVTYAFIAVYALLLLGRAAWLGDPLQIPLHNLQNGAFLLFSFFMISDPRTTPDTRLGRILYATLVAVVSLWMQFWLYMSNPLIWALVCCAPLVPVIDSLFSGKVYQWPEYVRREKCRNI